MSKRDRGVCIPTGDLASVITQGPPGTAEIEAAHILSNLTRYRIESRIYVLFLLRANALCQLVVMEVTQ
jgi:hypothetical protein